MASILLRGGGPLRFRNEPELPRLRGQPDIRVILAKQEPVLRSAGKHPVRLLGAAGDQVVDQDADIRLGPAETKCGFTQDLEASIDSCHKALGCSLFVAGGAIDLARKKEAAAPGASQASGGVA